MAKTLEKLRELLFSAKDGGTACDAINALSKHVKKGNEQAKNVLADYVSDGSIKHMRQHACSSLAEAVTEADTGLVKVFQQGLRDDQTRYWSILGYIRSAGRAAYDELARIAGDNSISVEERSHAVKCLAACSGQPFDRGLPSDPGNWKESDVRLLEIAAWANAGYPDGKGYSEPSRHPSLEHPKTDFEKVVSRFDKKLAKIRRERQDLANPTNWLSPADPADLQRITGRWELPSTYLDFLTRFSPIKVTIANRKFWNHLQLFGAAELIDAQDGYSFNPTEQEPIEDWPSHLVVIASHGGDPFVLDLSKSDVADAPVDTAEHGAGVWKFGRAADSFCEFLASLAK